MCFLCGITIYYLWPLINVVCRECDIQFRERERERERERKCACVCVNEREGERLKKIDGCRERKNL